MRMGDRIDRLSILIDLPTIVGPFATRGMALYYERVHDLKSDLVIYMNFKVDPKQKVDILNRKSFLPVGSTLISGQTRCVHVV